MDKITKFLQKLSKKERGIIYAIIEQLHLENTKNLDIKKLKGEENLFRVRRGRVRIVYSLNDSNINVVKIELRNEGTYK